MAGGMRENFIPWTSFHVTCTPRSSSFLISSPVDPPLTSRHPLVPPSGGQGPPLISFISFVSRQQASCFAPGLGKTLNPVLATAPPQTAVALSGHPGTGFATIATPLAALAAGAGEGRGTLVSFDTVGSSPLASNEGCHPVRKDIDDTRPWARPDQVTRGRRTRPASREVDEPAGPSSLRPTCSPHTGRTEAPTRYTYKVRTRLVRVRRSIGLLPFSYISTRLSPSNVTRLDLLT